MKRTLLVLVAGVVLGAAGLTGLAAGQENMPGASTVARVFMINRSQAEAIPVNVHSSGDVLPVTVMNAPPATLAPNAVVGARRVPQAWEYQQLRIGANEDAAAALNAAGTQGWEAIATTPAGAVAIWTLKRPR